LSKSRCASGSFYFSAAIEQREIMSNWPRHPVIYEINTFVWLRELSERHRQPITLANVPAQEWDAIAVFKPDAVWLMGVWERSPAGIAIALRNENLLHDFRRALPDFTAADVAGSPYCVRQYEVDAALGGRAGLAAARKALKDRGMLLLLDFVPNHVAPDHPWVHDHPDYFIAGTPEDAQRAPQEFFEAGGQVIANGRDPFFPPWPDVAQLNAFNVGLRKAVIETLIDIGRQCDGVRCDMAMLMIREIFAKTWGGRAGDVPLAEYWMEIISAVKAQHLNMLFMAEAYWDREWELQQQGFDYCYDKRLYDRLEHEGGDSVQQHLSGDVNYQNKLVRFIENHDEPRAAAAFGLDKQRAAAVVVATLPGARLLHEGQFDGRTVRLPVFLSRRPMEFANAALGEFYLKLLNAVHAEEFQGGEWRMCRRTGWPGNHNHFNIVAWGWRGQSNRLIVVNLSGDAAQARVQWPWDDVAGKTLRMQDAFSGAIYDRDGGEVAGEGLYVDLKPWAFHFLGF
jgi:glycosidase